MTVLETGMELKPNKGSWSACKVWKTSHKQSLRMDQCQNFWWIQKHLIISRKYNCKAHKKQFVHTLVHHATTINHYDKPQCDQRTYQEHAACSFIFLTDLSVTLKWGQDPQYHYVQVHLNRDNTFMNTKWHWLNNPVFFVFLSKQEKWQMSFLNKCQSKTTTTTTKTPH